MKKWIALGLSMLFLLGCAAPEAVAPPKAETQTVEVTSTETKTQDGPATVDKLQVVHNPDKMEYLSGELFDPTGLVINAILSDGTIRENVPFEVENGDKPISNKAASVNILCEGKKLMLSIKVVVAGNAELYSVANTETVADSPVKGNVYYWLGSSVTFGASSEEESMVDFFAKKYDCTCIKEAVSGTTLNASNTSSYVARFDRYLASEQRAAHLDGFICQLSTNDTRNADAFGVIMPDFITGADAFDVNTTFGAIEYIIAKARETWDCPIYFYTNPPYNNKPYDKMVEGLMRIAEKWDITVIDMYHDEAFNAISDADRRLYMADTIHPTKAGYREWWLPKFAEAILPAA